MPSKIGSIFVDLGLRTATFQKRLKRATSNLGRSVRKMKAGLRSMAKPITLVTSLLGGLGAISFTALIRSTLESVDALTKQADRLGVSTEALAGYRHAANLAGATNEDLQKAIEKMNRNIGDVSSGIATSSSTVARAFKNIGLSVDQLKSMSPEESFELVTQRLSEIPDVATRTSAAMAILGRSGGNLGNLIQGGADGLRAAKEEAVSLGVAINRVDAAKIEMTNDAVTRLKAAFAGFGNQLTVRMAPILTMIADGLSGAASEGKGFGDVLDKVINIGVTGFGWLLNGLHFLKISINAVVGSFWKFAETMADVSAGLHGFSASVLEVFDSVVKGVQKAIHKVASFLEKMINSIGNFFVKVGNSVLKGVTDMVNKAINKLIAGSNAVKKFTGGIQLPPLGLQAPTIDPVNVQFAGPRPNENAISYFGLQAQALRMREQAAREMSALAAQNAGDRFGRNDDLVSQSLPSERIRDAYEAMKTKSNEAAQQIAENAKKNISSLDETKDKADDLSKKLGGIGRAANLAGQAMAKMSEDAKAKMEEARARVESVSQNMTRAFDQFVESGKLSFKGFVRSIAADLTKLAARNAINSGFQGQGQSLLGGYLGWFSQLLGGPIPQAIPVPGRASGGPVTGGQTYLVGERGPELFRPGASGTIIPNHDLRAVSSSGGSTTIHETYNIQPGVSREELRVTLQEVERLRIERQRQMIESGEATFAGLVPT